MKNNILNKLTNLLSKIKVKNAGRRRRRTVNRNPIRLNIGRGTSALGPQFRTQMVTQFLTGALDEPVRIAFYDLLSSIEFTSVSLNWRFFKLQSVSVTVYPNNNNTTSSPAYLLMNWGDGTTTNLRLDNNVKIIPAFRTKFYTYTWNSPAMENDGITFNKYHPVDEAPLFPGSIQIQAPSNIDVWTIRIDVKVKFKGSKIDGNTKNEERKMSDFVVKNDEIEKEKEEFLNKIKKIYKIQNISTQNHENQDLASREPCTNLILTQEAVLSTASNPMFLVNYNKGNSDGKSNIRKIQSEPHLFVNDIGTNQASTDLGGSKVNASVGTAGETGTENPGSCLLTNNYKIIDPLKDGI